MAEPGIRRRRWLLAGTLLAGGLTAVAVAATATPADLTLAAVAAPTQSVMSVSVPLIGILLVHDRPARGQTSILPTLAAVVPLAAVTAMFGCLASALATAVPSSTAAGGRWQDVGTLVVGSLLVQVTAALVGTGLMLLMRSRTAAFVATIVLPLGLWLALGVAFPAAQAWLTPYGSAQNLLSGRMSTSSWAQSLTVLLIWGLGLNALGWRLHGSR